MSWPLLEALSALLLPCFKEQVVLMVYEKWNNPDGSRKSCTHSDGCERPIQSAGLCGAHYHRARKLRIYGESTVFSKCPVPGCARRKLASSQICAECRRVGWRYGIDPDRFIEMMLPENRICANPGCRSGERLHIDHDHSCCPAGSFPQKSKLACGGCVRGWLCHSCNVSLGQMQESPERIRGLLTYLETTKRKV